MAASIASNLRSTYALKSAISCGTSFSGGTPDGATEGEVVNVPQTSSATFVGPTGDDGSADAAWIRDGPGTAPAVTDDATVSGWALRRCVYGAADAAWIRDGPGDARTFLNTPVARSTQSAITPISGGEIWYQGIETCIRSYFR